MKKYYLYLLISMLFACKNTKPIQDSPKESVMEKLAYSHLGDNYATKENQVATHIIVFRKYKKLEELFASIKFFVFEKSTQSIIFEDTLKAGSVAWDSDFEVIAIARNLRSAEYQSPTRIYYYDVRKKQKRMHEK